ncbi:MAG: UDP-N-acetylmuramoyl-tripeptide--D-alanyl-D-alanine ligase [Proteobacteria bacterium]|nr:UDP-N-acetylmuramoyl-tripeptide--D-alanyl-D-alanine ligase [Pseudomonadota bacterium]
MAFPVTWAEVAAWLPLDAGAPMPACPLTDIVIDSRAVVPGALFVALRGERFDGHDFLPQAQALGAGAALVSRRNPDIDLPQWTVPDTLAGLQQMGQAMRARFTGPVAAITGSSGKTTTRALLVAILSEKGAVHQPERNFNNHVGVPLTLLGLRDEHDMAVCELGCSDFGEIAALADLVNPDVALVTNVGPAHLEKLGDLDGVARAKGELWAQLRKDAAVAINLDDPRVVRMPTRARRRIAYSAVKQEADVVLRYRQAVPEGQQLVIDVSGDYVDVLLPLHGRHNATNAVAAAAAAILMGASTEEIQRGLARVQPAPGRMVSRQNAQGLWIIDDTYNANPASVAAALHTLAELQNTGRKVAVLGEMRELGPQAAQAHREVGALVASLGLDALIAVGEAGAQLVAGAVASGMASERCYPVADQRAAAIIASEISESGDVLLIKGSRGAQMEIAVAGLTASE